MKKNFFLGALLLPGLFYAQSNPEVPVDENGIGKLYPDCVMSGSICNLFPTGKAVNVAGAFITKDSEKAMTISIKKSALTEPRQIDILGKKFSEIHAGDVLFFNMTAPYTVDRTLLDSLTMNPVYKIIPIGHYDIAVTADYVEIRFVLTDK